MKKKPLPMNYTRESWREHRRRRFRRHGRRAYIRSAYSLPSLATLGNAICGFGAIYVAGLDPSNAGADWWTQWFAHHRFLAAAYLIFLAMVFDALDGRLARFTRHTTDFGGQLDSLADVISFGVAPAFLALQLFRHELAHLQLPVALSRLIWAFGAIYLSCAALRLARFNVSNEHGEQHHFSFLGLPSPGAAGTVAGMVLMQQELALHDRFEFMDKVATACVWLLPVIVLSTGLLMVSAIRYPHLVNKYLRGKRSLARLLLTLSFLLLIVVAHRYVLALGTLAYSLSGPISVAYLKWWPRRGQAIPPPSGLPEAQPP
jgi:CDP-diacylglycerol--serine O-phosphatidyltransferase